MLEFPPRASAPNLGHCVVCPAIRGERGFSELCVCMILFFNARRWRWLVCVDVRAEQCLSRRPLQSTVWRHALCLSHHQLDWMCFSPHVSSQLSAKKLFICVFKPDFQAQVVWILARQ